MKVYKIRDKNNNLYMWGGIYTTPSTEGKLWYDLDNVLWHFSLNGFPKNWEIVEFEITEMGIIQIDKQMKDKV